MSNFYPYNHKKHSIEVYADLINVPASGSGLYGGTNIPPLNLGNIEIERLPAETTWRSANDRRCDRKIEEFLMQGWNLGHIYEYINRIRTGRETLFFHRDSDPPSMEENRAHADCLERALRRNLDASERKYTARESEDAVKHKLPEKRDDDDDDKPSSSSTGKRKPDYDSDSFSAKRSRV